MNDTLHPATSSEFLSRLHDGEVPAAEASAFESHRAGCAACREAAEAFAQSLAAFRSAEPAPAAADLSARILRKIRAQSPSRRPFGVMFGIDVRWAGVFVAALLVVLISAPALLRRPAISSAPAAPASIPARIVDASPEEKKEAEAPGPRRETRAEPARQAAAPPPPAAPAPPPVQAKDEAAATSPLAEAVVVAEAPVEEEKARAGFANAPRAKAAAPALRKRTTATELAGGEAGAANTNFDTVVAPPHLTVRALDSQGAPPALTSPVSDERFEPLRGSEFVIVVETQGRVRSVQASSDDGFLDRTDAVSAPAKQAEALEALRALRFAPGNRPRRLVVRIE